MFGVFLALTAMKHQEALSSQYYTLSAHYPWRPYLPNLPSIVHSSFKKPSNTTLEIESGVVNHVPPNLKKTTPNFHLLLPSERDTHDFCKTTLSAMLLDYPPPTTINLRDEVKSDTEWELRTLNTTLNFLSNARLVKDEDLVLIVDGQQSWFQLPSDVIVTQYKRLLEDANWRLLARYGVDADGYQKFNQTIVFGAEKMCVGDDMACRYVPHSILPGGMYGEDDGHRIADMPAKFINSKMVMGPAKDLRTLYEAGLKKFKSGRSQSQTVQSVFANIFGEQQLRRDAVEPKPATSKLKEFFRGKKAAPSQQAAARLHNGTQHEFSIGLDYLHILFQPLLYCAEDELVAIRHDNLTDLSIYRHPGSVYQRLSLPAALNGVHPPFWRPDLAHHNPSPNEKPAYVDPLEFDADLDSLPKRNTPWRKVRLIQNTYTGAVPAILFNDNPLYPGAEHPPTANITWDNLWFFPYKRALLRNYFRTPQSPAGYHNSLVGGDRAWDTRGGRGGVWTASTTLWFPWGEADGVCGSVGQLKEVFDDGRGVWMHEKEPSNEEDRLEEEKKVVEDAKNFAEEWQRRLKFDEQMRETLANLEKQVEIQEKDKQKNQILEDSLKHMDGVDDVDDGEKEDEEGKMEKLEAEEMAGEDAARKTKAKEEFLATLSDKERAEAERQRQAAGVAVARKKAKDEAEEKAKEEQENKAKKEQENKAKKEQENKAKKEQENNTKEEAEKEKDGAKIEKSPKAKETTNSKDEEQQPRRRKRETRRRRSLKFSIEDTSH
ncbi:hypothetical protein J1614_009967 [Plenodomus biglobosus]|nr:hypothetical protein J1614_009967 [Plenodomus biglobosus]